MLKDGAIALIDVLGFRGIWTRHEPSRLMSQMERMRHELELRVQKQFVNQPGYDCKISFLSDTVAISFSLESHGQTHPCMPALYLCDIVSWVLDWALRAEIPLAYRGAVSVGRHAISSNFLVGEAIDEAAAAHEAADGALVWLMPTARDLVADFLRSNPKNTHLVKFAVPIKDGKRFETYTVSPLEQAASEKDSQSLARTLLGTFSSSNLEVAIKKQNTAAHLVACFAWRNHKLPSDFPSLNCPGFPGGCLI